MTAAKTTTKPVTPPADTDGQPKDQPTDEVVEQLPAAVATAPPEPVRLFEPGRYLTKVGGADYLEVKWRLVWLREVHPDAVIETELVSHVGQDAIFRARVIVPGGGSATGFGSEAYDDFRDYIEKAETKALGRALAALGFGTQFCPDFEFGAREGRVVDAPVDFARTQSARSTPSINGSTAQRSEPTGTITPKQAKFLASIARTLRMSEEDLGKEALSFCGKSLDELGRRDASQFIEHLQTRQAAV